MSKNLLNIEEPIGTNKTERLAKNNIFQHIVFDLPFRSYFILAPLFALISLVLWLGLLNGLVTFNSSGLSPTVWHIHEMIFAFAATIAVAFILTAGQTWTGSRSLNGKPLVLLIVIWLLIRVAILSNNETSLMIAIPLTSVWWLMVINSYTKLVLTNQNRRNYLFIPILALMATLNIAILLFDMNHHTDIALHLSRSMILVFVLLMSLIGGRVIPFFTVRGANTPAIKSPKWLDPALILVTLIGLSIFMASNFIKLPLTPANFMIAAAILHLIRLSYWHSSKTILVPLLWSLHLSYLFIPLGLFLLGASYYSASISFSNALHLITIGAISLMILSMMSRVSLGHTGRALVTHKTISWAFMFMLLSALFRSFSDLVINNLPTLLINKIELFQINTTLSSLNISASLWVLAMGIFIIRYWTILTNSKP